MSTYVASARATRGSADTACALAGLGVSGAEAGTGVAVEEMAGPGGSGVWLCGARTGTVGAAGSRDDGSGVQPRGESTGTGEGMGSRESELGVLCDRFLTR